MGGAVDDDTSWPATVVDSVGDGLSWYSVTATLEHRSAASRELLALCRRAVARHAGRTVGRRDVVHWDFTLSILAVGDSVTGVVDWAGTRSGDRLFDLGEIERYVVARIGSEGLSVYLAHMAVRQSDWSLRHHGLAAGDGVVRYSLDLLRAFA